MRLRRSSPAIRMRRWIRQRLRPPSTLSSRVASGPRNMRQPLRLHPDSVGAGVTAFTSASTRSRSDSLLLSYVVTGDIGGIVMPPAVAAARGNRLWQHTCFEAFVRASSGAGYYEFNFSPSTQWAAYRFERLPKRDVRGGRNQRARRSKCDRAPTATHCRPRWNWIACRTCHAKRCGASDCRQ